MTDKENIDHPKHYNNHKSGIECIDVVEHMNFNLGNAMKYIWRHENKNGIEDLKKAIWYIEREMIRLVKEGESKTITESEIPVSYLAAMTRKFP